MSNKTSEISTYALDLDTAPILTKAARAFFCVSEDRHSYDRASPEEGDTHTQTVGGVDTEKRKYGD